MTDAERTELRKRYIVDFYMGATARPVWFQGCRRCGNSWLYGQPEFHAVVCPMKDTEGAAIIGG